VNSVLTSIFGASLKRCGRLPGATIRAQTESIPDDLSRGQFWKGGGSMIPTTIEKYMLSGIGAPRVITSTMQLEEYVSALLEFERQSQLTAAEENFAELLILLIQAYVEKPHSRRFVTPMEVLQELLSANDFSTTN
jgi:hypothetical protein